MITQVKKNHPDLWRFQGGRLLEIFGFLPQKASKSGLFGQKCGGLFKFSCCSSLIENGYGNWNWYQSQYCKNFCNQGPPVLLLK